MALEEVEVEHKKDKEDEILHETQAGAEFTVMTRGHKGPGVEGAVVRAQGCEGAGRAWVSTGDVSQAQGSEGVIISRRVT